MLTGAYAALRGTRMDLGCTRFASVRVEEGLWRAWESVQEVDGQD